jgi:hypothetical protein
MARRWTGAIALLCAMTGCRVEPEPVPVALLHRWRTDAPAYRDRHLEIREDWLHFGTGGYGSDLYPIVEVDSEPFEAGSTRYTIHYRADDGARMQLRLVLTPGKPDSLRIEHLDEIWLADPASAAPKQGV